MSSIPRPQMRRLMYSSVQKHVPIACVLSIIGGIAYKTFVRDARREKIAEFYRTYDLEKENARFHSLGLLGPK